MGNIVSRVRQLRLRLSVKRGYNVTVGQAAEGIGITRVSLSRMENDQTEQIAFETLAKVIAFYGQELGEPITAADVLGYEPNNKQAPELAGVAA